jgi:hypothetical protein
VAIGTAVLREDTGFTPAYDVERAVRDYIDWLRAGHERSAAGGRQGGPGPPQRRGVVEELGDGSTVLWPAVHQVDGTG